MAGISSFRRLYGASPLHLALVLGSLALASYATVLLGWGRLWNPDVWWQSVAVWFVGATIAHDLVLFAIYASLDRLLSGTMHQVRRVGTPRVPLLNHVRIPALTIGLTFLMFFPGIIKQGSGSYRNATGQTQEPFLERWLIFCAACVVLSALVYALRVVIRRRADARSVGSAPAESWCP